jgi:hypothetical protein
MDTHEQGFVIKFLWMRDLAPSAISQEFQNILGSIGYNEKAVENGVRRFVSGDVVGTLSLTGIPTIFPNGGAGVVAGFLGVSPLDWDLEDRSE